MKNFLDLLVAAEVAVVRTQVIHQRSAGGYSRLSWPDLQTELQWRAPVETPATYRKWLEGGGYSAQLFDGSLLQLSFDYRRDELVRSRLAYVPCPYDLIDVLPDCESIFEALELVSDCSPDEIRVGGPIRFDYDMDATGPNHSAAHLTLISPSARIPAVAPVGLGPFVKFVFKNFYPLVWSECQFLDDWASDEIQRTISGDEESELHVAWRAS